MLHEDLKNGWRGLLRAKAFSLAVAGVLALGIGANSAIFSVVNAVVLRPLPYSQPERLYQLEAVDAKGGRRGVPAADADALRGRGRVFAGVGQSTWQNVTLTGPEGPENVYGGRIGAGCFGMLGARAAAGRVFTAADYEPGRESVVVLSDRLWKRRYAGSRAVVGQTLMMSGKGYTIIGVMPEEFFFEQRYELWTPWVMNAEELGQREERFPTVVRLAGGAGEDAAAAEAQGVLAAAAPEEFAKGWRPRLTRLDRHVTRDVRSGLFVLLGAVGFVLLIACLNVANMLLARGWERAREMAIRAALGAGRWRLMRDALAESVLLAAAGGAAGLALGATGARLLVKLAPEGLNAPRLERVTADWTVLLFTLGVSLGTGLLFGLAPAWQAARIDIEAALRAGGRNVGGTARAERLRWLLVAAQTALSLVLLCGAGLMLRSFERLMSAETGFRAENVLKMRIPMPESIKDKVQKRLYLERVVERVRAVAGVNSAGLFTPLPLGDVDANGTFSIEGRPAPAGERRLAKLRVVTPGAFRALGVGLREGRVFDERDGAESPGVAVVNQAFAERYFTGERAVGRRVSMSAKGTGPWLEVVGVVNNLKVSHLRDEAQPEFYRDTRQFLFGEFATTLVARSGGAEARTLAAAIQREIRAVNPEQVIDGVRTMEEVVAANAARPRMYAWLLGVFAVVALVVAAAGLYGVISYAVSRRRQEYGIRMALGATRRDVLLGVARQALLPVGLGLAAGLAGALALGRVLTAQLYGVEPDDPWTLAAVTVLMGAVAAGACAAPARQAARVDPMTALRSE